jgi:hypothetical protein
VAARVRRDNGILSPPDSAEDPARLARGGKNWEAGSGEVLELVHKAVKAADVHHGLHRQWLKLGWLVSWCLGALVSIGRLLDIG